jgi:hypothetical protein
MGYVYGVTYLLFTSIPLVFRDLYGWSEGRLGLAPLGVFSRKAKKIKKEMISINILRNSNFMTRFLLLVNILLIFLAFREKKGSYAKSP